jgi:hypothetical protein
MTPRHYYLTGAAVIVLLQALILLAMGQPLICACGAIKLFGGVVSGPEMSQQLTDWYTYSHIIHGVGFYLLLWLIAPAAPVGLRFMLAIGLEAGWEVLENTPFVINRYRALAIAQGYFGDSVLNSISDTLAASFGFLLARLLPVWSIMGLVAAIELFVLFMIRDNLTLNIIQLIHPVEAISAWQAGP